MNNSELLTTQGAAKYLNCSPELVRVLANQMKLRSLRTENGFRVFLKKDVEKLAQKRQQKREAKQQKKTA